MRTTLLAVLLAALLTGAVRGASQERIDAAFGLQAQGATLTDVRAALVQHRGDDAIDFATGVVDFLLSGEAIAQAAHRHGFLHTWDDAEMIAGGRLAFVEWFRNPTPEPTTAADLHALITEWTKRLETAEATLAAADAAFACTITIESLRLDVDANGRTTSAESFGALFDMLPPRWTRNGPTAMVPPDLVVDFDTGDAQWLRGYCHILMGLGEWMLAHDGGEWFDHTAHVFFPRAVIPFDYLPNSTYSLEMMTGMDTPTPFDVTDILVLFGNMRFPVDEPDRMKSALAHFQAAVVHGKQMWVLYDEEQDDAREWIPNPWQTAAFPDVTVDEEMRDAWLVFLDEADATLGGKKVLRFWRGDGTRGIDVPMVFNEPRTFDLLYWLQGSAAAPYLTEGEFTTPETWAQLERVFNERVFRYTFWFN